MTANDFRLQELHIDLSKNDILLLTYQKLSYMKPGINQKHAHKTDYELGI